MKSNVKRQTVDLSGYPDLVVIYLGMRVNALTGGGTGFWHEAYFIRGGMEGFYADIHAPLGFTAFAPAVPARGEVFSARRRLGLEGEASIAAPLLEQQLYGAEDASTEKRAGD